jgi:Flp pilus assembly protein TadD
VVDATPNDAEQRSNLARALLIHDEVAEAVEQARAAVGLNPGDASARDLLALALAAGRR